MDPVSVDIEAEPLDVDFHPSSNHLLACSTIEGDVVCIDAFTSELESMHLVSDESEARGISWHTPQTDAGIVVGCRDKSWTLYDISKSKAVLKIDGSHDDSLTRVLSLYDHLFATADDGGCVKLWDSRSGQCIREYYDNDDYISDLAYDSDRKILLAAGGDGYLSVFDTRKKQLLARSDNLECELFSVDIIKDGKKVVVGLEDGVLAVFDWGDWGDLKDRIKGHPSSVDSIVKYDENTIFTGSSDGYVRVVDVYPTDFAGVLGSLGSFPIERMALSRDSEYLAATSHDTIVRTWSFGSELPSVHEELELQKEAPSGGEVSDTDSIASSEAASPAPKKRKALPRERIRKPKEIKTSFFSDLVSDSE